MLSIPFVDLRTQYRALKTEIDTAMATVIESSAFVGGEAVERFEAEFAAYCGVAACVGCGNGTDALYLALRALDVGPGDEVITVAHTFIATAAAITRTGARVVFVDVQPGTLVMDPDAVEQAITSRTRVILPVHLYGQPCDMARLSAITRRHGLKLVEDGAQAHGARWCGQQTGSFGDMACFSFYPGKNLGAYGDGGAVVGNDPALIGRVRMLANHGRQEKYLHEIEGMNSRLDGLQAAVLRVKLPYLDRANAARRRHAARYLKRLAGQDRINCPTVAAGAEPVWHLFVVQVDDRAAVGAALKARGIATGIHYPVPLHRQPVYADWGLESGALPVTEAAAARILSLPMFPELTEAQIEAVADALIEAVRTTTADASAAFDVTA